MSKEFDPIDLKGQERAKAEREVREKVARENEEADLKWLMGSKRGRRVVWRLLDQSGVFRLSFNTNSISRFWRIAVNASCVALTTRGLNCTPPLASVAVAEASCSMVKVL